MRVINATEAGSIVGGFCKTCTSTYKLDVNSGVTTCKAVTTCKDKFGKTTTTMSNTDISKCGQIPG